MLASSRITSRRSRTRLQRGSSTLEELLVISALMACFVYPLSLAIRAAGNALAHQMDHAERTILTQNR